MSDRRRRIKLSKFLALLLRHHPERFGLHLDREGWASVPDVLDILKGLPDLSWADRSDVLGVAREGTGNGKKRFEIEGDRIRALYGHSFDRRIEYEAVEPPPRLYHGTSRATLPAIREQGLRSMGRQYVHLSPDRETALNVGSRHASRPVLITVLAADAYDGEIQFYHPDQGVYLAKQVPPQFLEFPQHAQV